MGQHRDARIQEWQQRAGIQPAEGTRLATLNRMSRLAFDLIEVIALERAGIRDGDGQWSGCDPIASIVANLVEAERHDLQAWKDQQKTSLASEPSTACPGDAGGCMGDCPACASKKKPFETSAVRHLDLEPVLCPGVVLNGKQLHAKHELGSEVFWCLTCNAYAESLSGPLPDVR